MIRTFAALGAVATASTLTASASAGFAYGSGFPIVVPDDNVTVTVQFVYEAALWDSAFSFLGSGTQFNVTNPATDTGTPGLGQYLFNNQSAALDSQYVLQGTYNAGDILHFALDPVSPPPVDPLLLRTDDPAYSPYFAYDPNIFVLYIEDNPTPSSDLDFNDLLVCFIFTPVPAPGAVALLSLAALVGTRGRRRRSS